MKHLILILCFCLINGTYSLFGQPSIEQLQQIPGVVSVQEINLDTRFLKQYELYFEQPIDHKNPDLGHFKQRVILSHLDFSRPMVAIIEGYGISSGSQEELSQILNSNQINIEHRFFKNSRPDSVPWEKLTIWQAATDQHVIIKALKKFYSQPWVTTGISKGGQATMYHRSFYPDDVNASVPYVAPLNLAREDKRIYTFLNQVGTPDERKKIYDFQCLCFSRLNEITPILEQIANDASWTFEIGFEKAVQLTILEYSFAFWQWGNVSFDEIPGSDATAQELYNHLNNVAGFSFFEDHGIEENRAFFWTGLTEMGIYGYQTEPFQKFLGHVPDITFDFTKPKGTNPQFDTSAMQKVNTFLDGYAKNMLFIVGGLDTWSATAYAPSGKNNLVRMTLPNGHHGTRIRNFPKQERNYMYSLLEDWMHVKITDPFDN